MASDPRRAIVEVMARLGRETQLHLDERHRHFKITDAVIATISVLLVILAVFNVYYVRILYKDLNGIVANMESMWGHLGVVDEDMMVITKRIESFDKHMRHMEPMHDNMTALANILPRVQQSMNDIAENMNSIDRSMGSLGQGMGIIDTRVHHMGGGVATMRENVRLMARPMGTMNSFMP